MATINFNGTVSKVKTFDPNVDILNIDLLSAAEVTVQDTANGVVLSYNAGGTSITLTGVTKDQLGSSNVVFTDGSLLRIGDNGPLQFDHLGNVITGGSGDDRLLGLDGDDTISGGAGDDKIKGNKDDDVLSGDGGDDQIKGGAGDDIGFGGSGDDELFGGAGNDALYGGTGNDSLFGDAGDVNIYAFDDVLNGENGVGLRRLLLL